MWEHIVVRGGPRMTILLMRNARSNPQARNTHSPYVILITFPLQQWFRERALMLPYTSVTQGAPPFPSYTPLWTSNPCTILSTVCPKNFSVNVPLTTTPSSAKPATMICAGDYTIAALQLQYKKYIHKRTKHLLL